MASLVELFSSENHCPTCSTDQDPAPRPRMTIWWWWGGGGSLARRVSTLSSVLVCGRACAEMGSDWGRDDAAPGVRVRALSRDAGRQPAAGRARVRRKPGA